jgi:uncharacterized protein with NAD-binding domain and iron-sulfur cluster
VTEVTVIGGGLAGMAAALRLAERGCRVSLYESSDHLGGKASAIQNGADFDEHGFHIFPGWYHNIWTLVDELGIRKNFIDCHDFQQLKLGEFPCFRALHDVGAPRNVWRNLTSGILSFHETLLFFYSTLDLASFKLSEARRLDQLSVTGFLRSRFYRTEKIATVYQDLMLKAISVPSHFVSAMTTKRVIRFWALDPLPMHRILNGNLRERFIDPFERRLLEKGVSIYKGHKLKCMEVGEKRVIALTFHDNATGKELKKRPVDRVVLAIPASCLQAVCDEKLYAACRTLGDVRNLRSRPMASLNLYFKNRVHGLPADHVNLIDSKYGLTFIDVSQHWTTDDGNPRYDNTVLNVIATDFTQLEGVDEKTATDNIVQELVRFIPTLDPDGIDHHKMNHNNDAPLFMNDVGIWHYRPEVLPDEDDDDPRHQRDLENLFLAGDYCRSHVDLVSMEGAFTTGLKAAEAVRQSVADLQRNGPKIYETPKEPNRFPFLALWFLGLPFAAAAKLVAIVRGEPVGSRSN